MEIKNEFVKIEMGDKKYEFNNLILDEFLKRFVLAQTNKDMIDNFPAYFKSARCLLLKFDTPFENLSTESELHYNDFDICVTTLAQYVQSYGEKQITIQYKYETENQYVRDIPLAKEGIWGLSDYYGRKITAIGFTAHWTNVNNYPILAVLDTHNYNIYLQKDKNFTVTRKDIISTDAEFWTSDKSKVPCPAHLVPCDIPQIINQPDIGTVSFNNKAHGILYSVGLGQSSSNIQREYIIGQDIEVTNNGTELEFVGLRNEEIDGDLYPSYEIYPGFDIYPQGSSYTWVIFKYKLWQLVAKEDSTQEEGFIQEVTDTGHYYLQSIPLEKFGDLKIKIKYERG